MLGCMQELGVQDGENSGKDEGLDGIGDADEEGVDPHVRLAAEVLDEVTIGVFDGFQGERRSEEGQGGHQARPEP
ncbi:hypothetical protein D3C87_1984670 [compost metagenome]